MAFLYSVACCCCLEDAMLAHSLPALRGRSAKDVNLGPFEVRFRVRGSDDCRTSPPHPHLQPSLVGGGGGELYGGVVCERATPTPTYKQTVLFPTEWWQMGVGEAYLAGNESASSHLSLGLLADLLAILRKTSTR